MTLISIQAHNLVHNVSTIIICRGETDGKEKSDKGNRQKVYEIGTDSG